MLLTILNHVEDVQVACFAVIFGMMVYQSRQDWTIRFAWYSYLLASAISVIDLGLPHPLSSFTIQCIYILISVRYALLVAAMVYFTRWKRWPVYTSLGLAACSLLQPLLWKIGIAAPKVTGFAYLLLGFELSIACMVVLRSSEKATVLARFLLGTLFALSATFRFAQMVSVFLPPSPLMTTLREQTMFFNSTIIGCLLPFTIIWLMNTRVQSDLLQQSRIDPLTDLLNRRGLEEAAKRELARYRRGRQDFAVAVVDIDHFKQLNDTHGHASGDEVLRKITTVFREVLRQTDVLGRTGGEEFVFLLPMMADDETIPVMERLRRTIESRIIWISEAESVNITVSIGITHTGGRNDVTWDGMHDEADRALYVAKKAGRNRTVPFRSIENSAEAFDENSYGSAGALPIA